MMPAATPPSVTPPRRPAAPSALKLPTLVLAELFGISLWFSSSAALPALVRDWGLAPSDGALLLSAVQLGFIAGTLLLALTNIADVLPASKVFLTAAALGAVSNLAFAYASDSLAEALAYRFVTGLALAGIYPVGMKVLVSWSPGGIGNALGWLIGALTAGSASPFLLAAMGARLPWQSVFVMASLLAVLSGLAVAWVGDGPYLGPARRLDARMLLRVFRIGGYRRAALGYFGHMWELYAFWALAPALVLAGLAPLGLAQPHWISLGAFLVIGIGALGCIGGGILSGRLGSRAVASLALAVSGSLCLAAPLLLALSPWVYLPALLVWGVAVVADSAQFSALAARASPQRYVGTALTMMNCIGFAITVVSIQWSSHLFAEAGLRVAWLLAPGPLLGLLLLNWTPGGAVDDAADAGDDGPAVPLENRIAAPLSDAPLPQRSGGPSLF